MEKLNSFKEFMSEETNGQTISHAVTFLAKLVFGLVLVLARKEVLTDKDLEGLILILK
jgi:hypothetical protein